MFFYSIDDNRILLSKPSAEVYIRLQRIEKRTATIAYSANPARDTKLTSAEILWGDGSSIQNKPLSIGPQSHSYEDDGKYTIKVDVFAGDVLCGSDSMEISL